MSTATPQSPADRYAATQRRIAKLIACLAEQQLAHADAARDDNYELCCAEDLALIESALRELCCVMTDEEV